MFYSSNQSIEDYWIFNLTGSMNKDPMCVFIFTFSGVLHLDKHLYHSHEFNS